MILEQAFVPETLHSGPDKRGVAKLDVGRVGPQPLDTILKTALVTETDRAIDLSCRDVS